jgi:hypothetical protein
VGVRATKWLLGLICVVQNGHCRSRTVALTAPTPPVPTASTEQEHNHDDNQNSFYTHFEVLQRSDVQGLGGGLDETLDWPPCVRHFLGGHRACSDPRSLESLTGRGLSSLCKKEHT